MRLQAGDVLFKFGDSSISKIISKVTFGKATHVGILYDDHTIFETDGTWGKAEFRPLSNYNGKDKEIYRVTGTTEGQIERIRALCRKYEGTPYSYWDVALKGLLFWIHPNIAGKVSSFLGTRKFMICNELVMRILYEVHQLKMFEDYEESNPSLMLSQFKANPSIVNRIL